MKAKRHPAKPAVRAPRTGASSLGLRGGKVFPVVGIGARRMQLNARRLPCSDDKGQMILLAIEDVTGKSAS